VAFTAPFFFILAVPLPSEKWELTPLYY